MKIPIAIVLAGPLAFHSGFTGSQTPERAGANARNGVPALAAESARSARSAPSAPSSMRTEQGAAALVGMRIEDRNGREIGAVRDLLVHLPSGRIPSLVVSLGSLLGPDLWMLPPTGLQYLEDRKKMRLVLSRDELLRQERFSPSAWPDLDNTAFWTDADPVDPERRRIQAKQVYRATDIMGETVENPRGESLGKIRDLIIDIAIGQAFRLVLHFDPGVFSDERLAVMPITAFTPPPVPPHSAETVDSLLLEMSPSELRGLPVVRSASAGRWQTLPVAGR